MSFYILISGFPTLCYGLTLSVGSSEAGSLYFVTNLPSQQGCHPSKVLPIRSLPTLALVFAIATELIIFTACASSLSDLPPCPAVGTDWFVIQLPVVVGISDGCDQRRR